MKSTDDLTQHARFLRNAAPREFHEFLKAFQQYTDGVLHVLIECPGDELPRFQGHAQQCQKLLEVFEQIGSE